MIAPALDDPTPSPRRGRRAGADKAFEDEMLASMPTLRVFARGLCRDVSAGEDLVQETLMKAWRARQYYCAGTNFTGWIFKIARNIFYSDRRKSWRQSPLDDLPPSRLPATPGGQVQAMMLNDVRNALAALSPEQSHAIILVGAAGYSYGEAAALCGAAEGTVKSRVSRARSRLATVLESGDFRRDATPADQAIDLIIAQSRIACS